VDSASLVDLLVGAVDTHAQHPHQHATAIGDLILANGAAIAAIA